MTRVNLVLIAALLVSCLVLVKTSYQSRRLFNELDRERSLSAQLALEDKRLEAERQAQATHLRVEKVAHDKLGMRAANPAVTQYVTDPGPQSVTGPGPGVRP